MERLQTPQPTVAYVLFTVNIHNMSKYVFIKSCFHIHLKWLLQTLLTTVCRYNRRENVENQSALIMLEFHSFRDWGCECIQPDLQSKNEYEYASYISIAGELFKPNAQLLLFLLSFPTLQPSTLHLRWSAYVSQLWFTVSLAGFVIKIFSKTK